MERRRQRLRAEPQRGVLAPCARQVAFTYTEDKALVEHARQLKAEGKEACSLLYKPDLAWNPVRYACVLEQLRRQFKKFKTYYPKQH